MTLIKEYMNNTINPQSIAFDIDGVFIDVMSLFIEIAEKDYNIRNIKLEDITGYMLEECLNIDAELVNEIIDKIIDHKHDYEIQAIDSSAEILRKIAATSGEILFITARPRIGHIKEWIADQLYPFDADKIEIVATGSFEAKAEVLISKNKKYFLEDRLETCFDLYQAGISPILYKQPWNRKSHSFIEVASWRELDSLINYRLPHK
jgi:uncharacterized protein